MPIPAILMAVLSSSLLAAAEPPLEQIRFKDKFTLAFPAPGHVRLDSDRVQPAVNIAKLDSLYRIDAKVCRPDQQERKLTLEKVFWASGLAVDEVEKKEQLPNGDFLLVNKAAPQAKAVYFAKGARGYLQVNVTGPDSLRALVIRIARSLRNIEPASAPQAAVPLKLIEYVFDRDSVRVLVPEHARKDLGEQAAWYAPVDELDNLRLFSMSGFDYPYDALGNWQGAKGDDKEVAQHKIVNGSVHVLEMKPKGNRKEFYCYLGSDKENKIVIAGPREYSEVMRLMAESVGVR